MERKRIGVVVGSARKGSYSKTVADTLVRLMPTELEMRYLDIALLPIYNQDYDDEGQTPESYVHFRREVQECNGYLFVTPEHNRSLPALLKNALDIASRPMGSNVWSGKPGAVVSVSPGGIGGFGANHIIRQSLAFLNIYTMQQPEAYIGNVVSMIGDDGIISDARSLGFITTIAENFVSWCKHFHT